MAGYYPFPVDECKCGAHDDEEASGVGEREAEPGGES
jgi:hypothetical protein